MVETHFFPMATTLGLNHTQMKLVSHLHHMLLRFPSENVFDQSICRTKEEKTRLQCWRDAKSVMPSGAKMAMFLRRKSARIW